MQVSDEKPLQQELGATTTSPLAPVILPTGLRKRPNQQTQEEREQ